MSLRKAGMQRFEGRVNESMESLFPGELLVDAVAYECAGSGGRTFREFDDHGLPVVRKERLVRVRKTLMSAGARPAIGERTTWTPEGGDAIALRVTELPERPHELAWAIRCEED